MFKEIMNELIQATKQERRRIEEPRNRSRYFMFGKVDEHHDKQGYSVTFENVPDRVLRDARWSAGRDTPSLFKIGDIFIQGIMDITSRGVKISFHPNDINNLNIDMASMKRIMDVGIDYVMDNRELTGQLLAFLESGKSRQNQFLSHLLHTMKAIPMQSVCKPIAFKDLNPSQKNAIEKALCQRATFFWGPPGTGKTKTMGALTASLIQSGKRVLLTALSNMALDQLLLTTWERLQSASVNTSIARLGSTMDEKCRGFSREAFDRSGFAAKRAGMRWSEHVRYASLVAGNFAMLSFPRAANPGQFDFVIADEVSMANIPSLAVASFFASTGMVVGGDPFQLPPIYPEDAEEPNEWFRANVFEKAVITERNDPRTAFLDTQYRMQREIGDLVSQMFYDGDLKTGTASAPPLKGFGGRVVFINSPGNVETVGKLYFDSEEQRRFNEVHAESAAKAVLVALRYGVRPVDIGVIAPYNAQIVKIIQKLRENSQISRINAKELKVSTIHSFQGQERRVIVLDFTDDNTKPTRLTAKWELINVALSRSKEQLIIIGNQDYLLNENYFSKQEVDIFNRMLERSRIIAFKDSNPAVTDIKRRKSPEEEELNKKIAELSDLESDLAQRELDLATLHGELRAFEIQYIRIIGTRYAELDEIEAQIAKIQSHLKPNDKHSKKSAEQARTKAQESAYAAEGIQEQFKQEKFTPSESLKKLYREVAKSIHPDLANDEEERVRRERLMAEVNRAYEEGDEARLEAIIHDWESSPESVKGDGVGAELIRAIRKINQVKERLNVIEAETDQLKDSDLYQLKIKVEEAESEGRDLLGEMASQLDGQIIFAKQKLKEMKAKRSQWA